MPHKGCKREKKEEDDVNTKLAVSNAFDGIINVVLTIWQVYSLSN